MRWVRNTFSSVSLELSGKLAGHVPSLIKLKADKVCKTGAEASRAEGGDDGTAFAWSLGVSPARSLMDAEVLTDEDLVTELTHEGTHPSMSSKRSGKVADVITAVTVASLGSLSLSALSRVVAGTHGVFVWRARSFSSGRPLATSSLGEGTSGRA